jgi:hypothetical protein
VITYGVTPSTTVWGTICQTPMSILCFRIMPKKRGIGVYVCMGRLLFMVIGKMVECVECGKRLGFFRYYHPVLGKKSMVCGPCLLRVDESVVRWSDFVLSNSFNPESSTSTSRVDWSSLFNKFIGIRKHNVVKQKKNIQTHYDDTFVQLGRRTV